MQPTTELPAPTLYTVGHSNQALESFLDLLRAHRIEALVDTRSRPRSKFVPHFDVELLKPAVLQAGIKFVFMGEELGGRPEGAEYYDAEDHVLYDRVAQSPAFLAGLERLQRGLMRYRTAVLCSEENPAHCHRRLLVGRVLEQRGVQLLHIRAGGALQTEAALQAEEKGDTGGQQSLFELEEVTPWRSTQSVSRRRAPNSFSES